MSKSRYLIRAARQNFAIVAHYNPLPSAPIWDTSVYHPTGPIETESRASPIATSSRITLDHLLVRPPLQDRHSSTPRAIAQRSDVVFADWTGAGEALAFATDEELVQALLLPALDFDSAAIGVGAHDWHRTLDPALAFHALRSRGSYAAFLRSIRPYARSLYPRLRAAKVHQLFVSDLLLRHPDPLVLRDLLQMDGEVVTRTGVRAQQGGSSKLRASLVRSMYAIVRPSERTRYPLTAQANLSICRAMLETSDWDGLERAWMDLYDTTDLAPESNYQLLRLLIELEPHRRDRAMGLFSTMVTTGTSPLPKGILGKVDDEHPQTAQLLLRTAMVRACCRWKLYTRAQVAAEQLLDLAVDGASAEGSAAIVDACSVVRQVCRVSIASGQDEDLDWVGRMLVRFAELRHDPQTAKSTPRTPGRLIDVYISARLTRGARQEIREIYNSILASDRTHLSAQSLLAVAEAGGDEAALARVGAEMLEQSPETISTVVAPFIRALLAPLPPAIVLSDAQAGATLGLGTKVAYTRPSLKLFQLAAGTYLSSNMPLPSNDLVHIVRQFRPHQQLAQVILEEQESRLQTTIDNTITASTYVRRAGNRINNADRLALVEGFLLHGLRAMARRQLAALHPDIPDLSADIVSTLVRTPEIKRDLESLLGPQGLDMGWLIPQM